MLMLTMCVGEMANSIIMNKFLVKEDLFIGVNRGS
jgi:hypothetical protein